MRATGAAILLLFVFSACNAKPIRPADEQPAPAAPAAAAEATPAPVPAPAATTNIGTAEEAIKTSATVAEADRVPGITVDEQRTYRKDLALVNIQVSDPALRELWLSFVTTSSKSFRSRPVVAKLTVWREIGVGENAREREQIGATQFVLGALASQKKSPEGHDVPQPTYQVDALGGLDAQPDTMLISGELEILLLPEGTPESIVDPAAATAEPRDTAMKLSNPVRIDFAPTADAQ